MRSAKILGLAVIVSGLWLLVLAPPAMAQYPVAVTSYYAPQPAVTYFPERRGLFGQRVVYRPAMTYPAPAMAVAAVPAPSPVVRAYYAPPAPAFVAPAPVVVARPVAPVVVARPVAPVVVARPVAPVVVARPVAPVIVAPAPVYAYPPLYVP